MLFWKHFFSIQSTLIPQPHLLFLWAYKSVKVELYYQTQPVDALICPSVFCPKNTLLHTNNRGVSALVTLYSFLKNCILQNHTVKITDLMGEIGLETELGFVTRAVLIKRVAKLNLHWIYIQNQGSVYSLHPSTLEFMLPPSKCDICS